MYYDGYSAIIVSKILLLAAPSTLRRIKVLYNYLGSVRKLPSALKVIGAPKAIKLYIRV